MPAPSDSPEFATAATFTVDGDTWGGDATKADPGAPRRAEGFEPTTLPVEWINWILNNHGAWAVWLEDERARIAGYVGGASGSDEWAYPSARQRYIPLSLGGATPYGDSVDDHWYMTAGIWISKANSGDLVIPLNSYLRTGMEITNFGVHVKPGASRSGANKMIAQVVYRVFDIGSSSLLSGETVVATATHADTSTATQTIGPSVAPAHAVDRGLYSSSLVRDYYLRITAGNTGASAADQVHGAYLRVNDPGPRNY